MNQRPVYVVELTSLGNSIACLETRSVNLATNFLQTIDTNLIGVHFYRHNPYHEFNVKEILEVLKK